MSEEPFSATCKILRFLKMSSSDGESKYRFWFLSLSLKFTGLFYLCGGSLFHLLKVLDGKLFQDVNVKNPEHIVIALYCNFQTFETLQTTNVVIFFDFNVKN